MPNVKRSNMKILDAERSNLYTHRFRKYSSIVSKNLTAEHSNARVSLGFSPKSWTFPPKIFCYQYTKWDMREMTLGLQECHMCVFDSLWTESSLLARDFQICNQLI